MILIKAGIILPIIERSPSKHYYKISMYNKHYWVKKTGQRAANSRSCSLFPKCFTLAQNSDIYESPNPKSPLVSSSKAAAQLDWFGQRKIIAKKDGVPTNWFLVSVAERYGWVPAKNGELSENTCSGSVQASQRKWFFSAEASQQAAVSGEAYTSILTPVPDPTQVACLQNPLFRAVEEGTGQRFAVQTSHNFNSWLTLRAGLAYEQVKFSLSYLDNPHPDPGNTNCNLIPVNVNSLTGGETTITENNVLVPLGAFYRYPMGRNHSFFFGGELSPALTISSAHTYKFFTGQTLSKQTENIGEIAPTQFRFFHNFELRYLYQFPYTQREYFGLTVFAKMGLTGEYFLGAGIYL